MKTRELKVSIPLALRTLVKSNNELLKNYQSTLIAEIEEASAQMMQILRLDPNEGWRLDLDRMIYVRVEECEEEPGESTGPSAEPS